jgi:hypothetical protein
MILVSVDKSNYQGTFQALQKLVQPVVNWCNEDSRGGKRVTGERSLSQDVKDVLLSSIEAPFFIMRL